MKALQVGEHDLRPLDSLTTSMYTQDLNRGRKIILLKSGYHASIDASGSDLELFQ